MSPRAVLFPGLLVVLLSIRGAQSAACSFSEGAYSLQWYLDRTQTIHFQLTLQNVPYGAVGYTGVGFGPSMASGIDVIVVRVLGSRVTVNDESVMGYRSSWPDRTQDVQTESASFNNGVVQVRFSRPLRTNDRFADRILIGCQPWQFLTTLSRLAEDGSLRMHQLRPRYRNVCIEQCMR